MVFCSRLACGVERPLLRSGARPGDAVYLSGPLGLASAGLEILATRRRRRGTGFDRLVEAQRRPRPHVTWAQHAARFASAGIDVSDGLAQDLGHLAQASGARIDLQTDRLALDPLLVTWAGSRQAALRHALSGGEDYVLVVTVPGRRVKAFESAMAGFDLARIGQVSTGTGVRLDGKILQGRGGFQHFG